MGTVLLLSLLIVLVDVALAALYMVRWDRRLDQPAGR